MSTDVGAVVVVASGSLILVFLEAVSPSLPSPCLLLLLPAVSVCRLRSLSCRPMTLIYSIT